MNETLHSDDISAIVKALVKVQGEIKDAEKNSKNPHFKSSYANLEAVIHATREPLAKNGLVVSQVGQVSNGQAFLITLLMHESGQWLQSVMPILNGNGTAQGMGSALSYARRYALAAIAGITQVDDDGNHAVAEHHKGTIIENIVKPPPPPSFAPQSPKTPGDYVIQIGKNLRGQKIKDIDVHEVENFVQWIDNEAGESFKANPLTKEFMKYADLYLKKVYAEPLA